MSSQPKPGHKSAAMNAAVDVLVQSPKGPKLRTVRARLTRSPYFAITRRLGFRFFADAPFSVTHVPTGRSLFPADSIRQGELIAAIAAALPVKWDKVTAQNIGQAYAKLDPIWAKWGRELQFPKKTRRAA